MLHKALMTNKLARKRCGPSEKTYPGGKPGGGAILRKGARRTRSASCAAGSPS